MNETARQERRRKKRFKKIDDEIEQLYGVERAFAEKFGVYMDNDPFENDDAMNHLEDR
jgi:hypothetical protein